MRVSLLVHIWFLVFFSLWQESQEITMLNEVYQERFPKATAQMEEKLANFIQDLEQVRKTRRSMEGEMAGNRYN